MARHSAGASPTVLLVEDEVLIRHLVAVSTLSEHGFIVRRSTTANMRCAISHAGGETDALFTDVNLSSGMNGAELAVQVR